MKKTILLSTILLVTSPLFAAKDEENKRMNEAAGVLTEIMDAKDQAIPDELLGNAQCVGIVPNLKRVGFVVGAKYGKGVLSCRKADGRGWSAPSVIRIEGGNIGLQIGAGETDVVFVVMNARGEDELMKDKFTVGGDVTGMAGPVGRSAEAKTDALLKAEIVSYSRSRGLFAGVTLDGATLRPDTDANRELYGKEVGQREILHGQVAAPAGADRLLETLNRYSPRKSG